MDMEVIIGIFQIICAVGLFFLKEWARKATISLFAFSVLWWIFYSIPWLKVGLVTFEIVFLIMSEFCFFAFATLFLVHPNVKRQFS